MISSHIGGQRLLPATVLLVLGLLDLLRGILHTFFANWAARTFARLDLSSARQDQLMLLGAFGISNLLTGTVFILVAAEAPSLAQYVLLAVLCSYVIGLIGMRTSGVKPQSSFYGRYFMLIYLGVSLTTVVISRLRP